MYTSTRYLLSSFSFVVNAFNHLNHIAGLLNIKTTHPSIAPIHINPYRSDAELYVDSEIILSQEGTTQSEPLAMAMYALVILPLIHTVATHGLKQVSFADDATEGCHLDNLKT